MPRQRQWKWCHGNIPMIRQFNEIPVQKSKCADVRNMQEMGSDPRYRVSHMSVAWQKRGIASDNLVTVQTRTSHSTHAFGGRLGCYTFEACIFGAKRVRCNEEEVDVLAMVVVEVVVHVSFE